MHALICHIPEKMMRAIESALVETRLRGMSLIEYMLASTKLRSIRHAKIGLTLRRHRHRADHARLSTESRSRRSLQPVCWVSWNDLALLRTVQASAKTAKTYGAMKNHLVSS